MRPAGRLRARNVPVRAALLTHDAALAGAGSQALSDLRSLLTAEPRRSSSLSNEELPHEAVRVDGEEQHQRESAA